MKRRPWISVSIDPVNHTGFVGGYRAYDYIISCGGKPMYSRRRKAWSCSEHTAKDVLAMAESDGLAVQFERIVRVAS